MREPEPLSLSAFALFFAHPLKPAEKTAAAAKTIVIFFIPYLLSTKISLNSPSDPVPRRKEDCPSIMTNNGLPRRRTGFPRRIASSPAVTLRQTRLSGYRTFFVIPRSPDGLSPLIPSLKSCSHEPQQRPRKFCIPKLGEDACCTSCPIRSASRPISRNRHAPYHSTPQASSRVWRTAGKHRALDIGRAVRPSFASQNSEGVYVLCPSPYFSRSQSCMSGITSLSNAGS